MQEDRYYTKLAAAFVQGKLGAMPQFSFADIIQTGLNAGLRLHKFKRDAELPRVKKVLQRVEKLTSHGSSGTWFVCDCAETEVITSIRVDSTAH
ncbi:MAG: hypothetical protein AB1757_07560 [Acidobacteriota bacterium]